MQLCPGAVAHRQQNWKNNIAECLLVSFIASIPTYLFFNAALSQFNKKF